MRVNANIGNNNLRTVLLILLFVAGTIGSSMLKGMPEMMAEEVEMGDADSPFFTNNSSSESLWIQHSSLQYGTEGPVPIMVSSSNLQFNNTTLTNYTMNWQLSASGTSINNVYHNWTAYSYSSIETLTPWLSNLAVGNYSLVANLYYQYNSTVLDSDTLNFSIVDSGNGTISYTYLSNNASSLYNHVSLYGLTPAASYTLNWTLSNSSVSGMMNITPTGTSAYQSLGNWYNFSAGTYCLSVNLYNGSTLLDTDYICTTVTNSSGSLYVSGSTNGQTAQAYVQSYYLTLNANYTMTWTLEQSSTNSTYDNGSVSWVAYNNVSTENFTWTNLTPDWYCLNAYLFDDTGSMLDWDYQCLYISNNTGGSNGSSPTESIYAWANYTTYPSGSQVNATIMSTNLTTYLSYRIIWELEHQNNGTTVNNGTYTWTSYSTQSMEYPSWSYLPDGDYCLNADLNEYNSTYGNLTWLDYDYSCFQVGSNTNGTGNATSENIYAWTDNNYYPSGATVNATIMSTNLTLYEDYEIWWELADNNGTTIDDGNFTWIAYNTQSTENLTWTSLADGLYCLDANLYHDDNGTITWLDFDSPCFQVGNTTNSNNDSHCLTVGNFSMNSTYFVTIDLINICSFGLHYPGINASADHSGVSGFYNQTSWWYLIGANGTYNLSVQLQFDSSVLNNTNITLDFEAEILNCGTNGTWHDCPNSNDSTFSYQFTFINNTGGNNTGGSNTGYIFTSTDSSNYLSGATVNASIMSTNITLYEDYEIKWELEDGSGTVIDDGNFTWIAYNTQSMDNLTWSSLADGLYCLYADLSYDDSGTLMWLDYDYSCFQVGNNTNGTGGSSSIYAWTENTLHSSGETVNATLQSNGLTLNAYYEVEWELEDGNGTIIDYGNFTWTAYYSQSTENLTWTSLADGQYCLYADLYHDVNGTLMWLDYDFSCFQIGNNTNGTGGVVDGWIFAWTEHMNYSSGDTVNASLLHSLLTNGEDYVSEWELEDDNGTIVDAGNFTWTAYYSQSTENLTLNSLADGSYCLFADLSYIHENNGTLEWLDETSSCFQVGNETGGNEVYTEWINIEDIGSTFDENISEHMNFANGSIVYFDIASYDLDPAENYSLDYDMCKFGHYGVPDECGQFGGGFDFTINASNSVFAVYHGTDPTNQHSWNFTDGCYVISAWLDADNLTGSYTVAMDLGLTFSVGSPYGCEDYDGDGVNNTDDSFPADSSEWEDTDGDGVGNNADSDDDGDGLNDTADAFPLDPTEGTDTDGDGIGNNADFDDDGDGIADAIDNCPYVQNSDQSDADGDGIGTACDGNENTGGNNTGNNTSDDPCQAGVIDGENLPNGACCSSGSQCASEYCNYSNGTCENDPWNNGTDDNNTGDNNTDDPPNDPPGDDNNTGSGDNGDDDDDDDSSSGGGIPGFTSIIATVSLLGAAILARRKENSLQN